MSKAGATRIGIFHKNVPNVIAALTSIMSGDNINIEAMVNNSKGSNAYTGSSTQMIVSTLRSLTRYAP